MFVSFYGKALDEKAPLLRSMEAVSKVTTPRAVVVALTLTLPRTLPLTLPLTLP